MPRKPSWHGNLGRIRAVVQALNAPLLDRRAIEKAFGVGPRTAQELILKIGPERLRGHVVPRDAVLRYLQAIARGLPYLTEAARRHHVAQVLRQARSTLEDLGQDVRFPVRRADAAGRAIAGLPDTIRIAPGELRVAFNDSQDLFQQLFSLCRAIAKDFPAFEALVQSHETAPGRR